MKLKKLKNFLDVETTTTISDVVNLKKLESFLKEQTSAEVGTFVGTGGQEVDKVFAGGFHPMFGQIKALLQSQLDRKKDIGKWNKKSTPILNLLYQYIPSYMEYLDKQIRINKRGKIKRKVYDDTMEYDDYGTKIDNDKYINKGNKMKPIGNFSDIYKKM